MKHLSSYLLLFLAPLLWGQQETENPTDSTEISIPGPIADGTPPPPPQPQEMPDFKVIDSSTRSLEVVEAPPLPGLPPVAGTISIVTRKVEDPGLPMTGEPLPVDPIEQARLQELAEKYHGTDYFFVSATIYDHSRTLLKIFPQGRSEGSISAWSNIDFNHFTGFPSYRITQADGTFREVGLLMGVENIDIQQLSVGMVLRGETYTPPTIPALPDLAAGDASFVVVGEQGQPSMDTLQQMHRLYELEGERMAEAYQARVVAEEQRRAALLANPPKPKDVTIQYWRGKNPEQQGGER